jgi:tetratricopeptide (TPR) repeat protein
LNKRPAIYAICALLTLVTLVDYWPVRSHKFIDFDDPRYICDNPHVKAGLTWAGVLWAFRSGYAGNWHPLTWVSHMVDCQLYGLNPGGHHWSSLFLHVANTLLLFLLFQRTTGALWRSAVVAALFAWHPLRVESVAWAAERKDVLSAFFFLLTLWAYVRHAEAQSRESAVQSSGSRSAGAVAAQRATNSTDPAARYYLCSLLLFALGLMSKPMLVTLPFVLLLLDFWPLNRLPRLAVQAFRGAAPGSQVGIPAPAVPPWRTVLWPLVREKLPFFSLAMASCVITWVVQRIGGAMTSLEILPWQSRVANALVVYVRYLLQTLHPARLAVIYPYSEHLSLVLVTAAVLLLFVLSVSFLLCARRRPFLIVGWLWYLGTLVPTIGLVQVGAQSMADRYTYLPSIGLFLLIVWGLDAVLDGWPLKRPCLVAAGTLAAIGCLACTRGQLDFWRDSERLFRHAVAVTRDNYIAYDGLGSALEVLGKPKEALACYSEAVRLQPHFSAGQYDFGTLLLKLGRLPEAIQHLDAAVKNAPAFAHAHINLGKALLEQGQLEEAAGHLSRAVQLTPDDAEAHYNLGTLLVLQAKLDQAIGCFSEALRLRPDYAEAHGNLGVALMRQGKLGEGANHLATALRLSPGNPEAHYNLGLALLELSRPREAADQFTEALRLNPDAPGPHYHLALALFRQDQAREARLLHAQKARDLALAAGQPILAAKAEQLLK